MNISDNLTVIVLAPPHSPGSQQTSPRTKHVIRCIEKWEGWGQSLLLWELFAEFHSTVVARPYSPRYLHIPLRPHKEATLSRDQTRLYSHKFWFLSPDTKLSRVLSWVKGWLSPKLCDFCAALIQWLVLCPCDTGWSTESPSDTVKWFC